MNNEIRVLIADENSETRKNIRELLRERGIKTVLESDNGDAALQTIKNTDVDVVICDAWLGGIDGISLVRMGTELKGHMSPAFIVLTQVASQNIFVDANRAGAELCLTKPVDYAAFTEHFDTICRNRGYVKNLPLTKNEQGKNGPPADIESQVTKITLYDYK